MRIVVIFLVFGCAWIWLSDYALILFGIEHGKEIWFSIIKGTLFVILTSALIYWLVRRELLAVARSNNLLHAVAEGTADAVFVKDRDGKYLLFNAAAARFVGKPVADVLGRDDTALFDPESARRLLARDRRIMEEGIVETKEEVLTAAGITRTYLATKAPYRDEKGNVVGIIGISHDITDLRRTKETLRNERTLLRTVIDSIPDLIFSKDADGRFQLCNQAYLDFSGRTSEEEILGKTDFDLFAPDRAAQYHADDVRVVREGISILDREEMALDAAGVDAWRSVIKVPLKSPDGAVVGLVGISRNIQLRKERERALAEAESHLRLFVEHVPAPIAMLDRELRYLHVSRRWMTDYNLGDRDIVGRGHYEVFPEIGNEWKEIHRRCLAGAVERRDEDRFVRSDGTVQWLRWEVRPWRGADGAIGGIILLTEDITARKATEDALRESEERYRRLVEVLPTAVFIHSNGKVVYCNRALVALLGASSPEDLIGRDPTGFADHEFREIVRQRIVAMEESGRDAPGIEIRVVRLDGRPVPVLSVSAPLTFGGERGFLVAFSDLTERERSADLLQSVLGSVNDAILTVDEHGSVLSANPATRKLFGYSPEDLIGQNVRNLMPEPYRDHHDDFIKNYLRTGIAKVIGIGKEFEGRRIDGTTFPVELTVSEFLLDGERHFTGVVRDITARKRLEAQFHQAQKMEAVGRLASGVAHDFNNLLTVINGYCELLMMGQSDPATLRESLASIRDAGDRAARLTQQLLAFSRRAVVEPTVLDLNELVEQSAKLLRRLIGEDIVLSVEPCSLPARIKADIGQMEQMILNLAVNARDAMPSGGRLRIALRNESIADGETDLKPGAYVRLEISDTGEGMPAEVRDKIFEPFFTTKPQGKGTGLGLAVVHGVVQQCGGTIAVESEPGKGTTFVVHFPAIEGRTGSPESKIVRHSARGEETLLLVEDEQSVRMVAKIALESQGFRVLVADGGSAAIGMVEKMSDPIHLVVSDVVMPEMGGRELVGRLRTIRPGLRVLFMSGYTDDAVIQHGNIEAGESFIQKPFTPLGLARKVRAVLDGSA